MEHEDKLLLGTAALFTGSTLLIILNSFGLSGMGVIFVHMFQFSRIISIILAFCILITSVYYYDNRKFSSYGYILCLVGSISMISFQIYVAMANSSLINPLESLSYGIKHILFGMSILLGLILNHRGDGRGRRICLAIGTIDLVLQFLPFLIGGLIYIPGILGGGFLNIYLMIQFEPFLILIGGYFLDNY
jgi:hypothetical protein